jgi:hypothetical protein
VVFECFYKLFEWEFFSVLCINKLLNSSFELIKRNSCNWEGTFKFGNDSCLTLIDYLLNLISFNFELCFIIFFSCFLLIHVVVILCLFLSLSVLFFRSLFHRGVHFCSFCLFGFVCFSSTCTRITHIVYERYKFKNI